VFQKITKRTTGLEAEDEAEEKEFTEATTRSGFGAGEAIRGIEKVVGRSPHQHR
jgi:hypothetical protein